MKFEIVYEQHFIIISNNIHVVLMTNVMALVFGIFHLCLCIKHLSNPKFIKSVFLIT
ncbi:hypothetical protein EJK50_0350 [Moraxella catarrhalis]|nr:hypothetical protein EJK50_0350 [Moraxella catarrhalis]